MVQPLVQPKGPPARMKFRSRGLAKLTTATALSTVVAVAYGASASAASDSSHSAKSPLPITLFSEQDPRVLNYDTNAFTVYLNHKFGLKLNFQTVDPADLVTKEGLLLESGDPPDVIFDGSMTQADVLKWGTEGVLIPLNSLLTKYAPNVVKAIDSEAGLKQAVTAPNGKIYALPSYNYCVYCSFPEKYFINIQDLNKYNLSMPTTTAQFEHVLTVFHQHGLIALTAADNSNGGWGNSLVPFLMNAFIPFDSSGGITTTGKDNYFDVTNGTDIFVPTQPQWEQGLEYIHGLYESGLFSETALTQSWSSLETLVAGGKVGVFAGPTPEETIENYGEPSSGYLNWLTVPALKGPDGVQSAAFDSAGVGGLTFAITDKASKAQEIGIMHVLNYIFSPVGEQEENFGLPGKYWVPAKKGQEGLVPEQALFNTFGESAFYAGTRPQNTGWDEDGPFNGSVAWRNLTTATPPFTSPGELAIDQLDAEVSVVGHQEKWLYPPNPWVPADEAQQYSTEQTNIDSYIAQWTAEFITGQKSITGQWTAYLSGLKSLGLSSYIKLSQKVGTPAVTDTDVASFEKDAAQIKYLLSLGPVPKLDQKYLEEVGVPATDFAKG